MINNSLHLQYVGNSSATIVTKMPADTKFRQVAISNTLGQGCGITVAGKLECWTGEITPGDGEFVQVVAGDTTVCGLTTDHDAMCWAYTGNGAPFGEATPPEQKFTQLAAGFYHFCGLRDDGKVFCWGAGSSERAPNCNSSDIHYDCSQAQPPTDKFVQITAGRLHTCGLKADGSVKCWGLGVNSLTSPGAWEYGQSVPPPSEVFSSISAGQWHTCGIRKSDGTAVCWGAGKSGASAQYDHGQSEPTDDSFLVLSAGWVHTCGLTTQNRMVCWGANDDGEAPPSTLGSFPLNPGR
jgi:hypothetical protein